jgi:hypothetical protein
MICKTDEDFVSLSENPYFQAVHAMNMNHNSKPMAPNRNLLKVGMDGENSAFEIL